MKPVFQRIVVSPSVSRGPKVTPIRDASVMLPGSKRHLRLAGVGLGQGDSVLGGFIIMMCLWVASVHAVLGASPGRVQVLTQKLPPPCGTLLAPKGLVFYPAR